jgi:hypothetical protein
MSTERLAPGAALPGTTTLAELIDQVYPSRSPDLDSGSATFVIVSPQVISARWDGSDSLINITLTRRMVDPDLITLDPLPTLVSLTPDTGPANTDTTIAINGTNFDPDATVMFGTAWVTPSSPPTPTDLSVDIGAVALAQPGTIMVKVRDSSGLDSNELPFTAT